MAPSTIRRALGAVKDQTSIGIAKVTNSATASELDVAIVKATRHDEFPADEKHIREILSLTSYSRVYVSSCVSTMSRRLGKTRSWNVALKTLILVHRLLSDGDPSYEQEIFFATRRGTRMLNMSDFRDTSRSDAWDFSAFVRTYARYLDERLDYRMHGRRARRKTKGLTEEEEQEAAAVAAASSKLTPVRDMKTEKIFVRTQHLQQLMDRFLACRPTGAAKNNRIVAVALYPLVKESFQLYYDLAEIMNIFIDRFMELEVPECVRVHETFARLSKQFDELDSMYNWCKTAGICRSNEYPEVERITQKKLDVMDEFIRDKSALAQSKRLSEFIVEEPEEPESEDDANEVKALPAPEPEEKEEEKEEEEEKVEENKMAIVQHQQEADLLHLFDDVMTTEEHGNQLALMLFDGEASKSEATATLKWEAFGNDSDWETTLVQTASGLSGQKAELGGGFDMMLLDGMYTQAQNNAVMSMAGAHGSASSMAIRPPSTQQSMLALPAPPVSGGAGSSSSGNGYFDPFAASLVVPAPSYVQMSELEKKQHLLTEEQIMWQQYARNGMQGQVGWNRQQPHQQQFGAYTYNVGGYYNGNVNNNNGHMF